MGLAETARLLTELSLRDGLTPGLARAQGAVSGFSAGVKQMGTGVGQVGAGLARVGSIAATGFAVGVGLAVKAAADFQAQLNTINTIALTTPDKLAGIGEGIRQTFRDTGQPLADLTAAYYDLLSAGVKVTDAQKELDIAVRLGIGGLGTTTEAIDLLTTAQNSYGLSATGVANAADIFAKAVEDGKVKINEIAGSFADVAPLAKQAGIRLEELGAGYAFLTAKGVPAAEVTTQMNRAIIELIKPTGDLLKVQSALGGSFADMIKQKGLVGTLEAVRVEADKLGLNFGNLFTRIEGRKFALLTTGDSFAAFSAELAKFGHVSGTVQEQFAARAQGFTFELARLKAGLQDAGITIGNALLPKLTPLLAQLSTFLATNQDKIGRFGDNLATGFSKFADKLGQIDFGPLLSGLRVASGIAKTVFDLFTSLPPALQGAIVTGFALNKLSGGLIGQGVGNIAGGLIKIAFERGSSPANPLWVQSVGGIGGGVPGVAGRGAGALGTALGVGGAIVGGFAIGGAIGGPMQEKMVAPARTFETGIVDKLVSSNTTTREQLVKAIGTIDTQLGAIVTDPLTQIADGSSVLAGYFTGQPSPGEVLQQQKTLLQQKLDAINLTDSRAAAKADSHATAQVAAAAKVAAAARDTRLAVLAAAAQTRGQNNAALAAAARAHAAQLQQTALQQANASRMEGSLGRIEAKGPPIVTVSVSTTSFISISDVVRQFTNYVVAGNAAGSGPGGVAPSVLF